MKKHYIIRWNAGYGDMYEIVEAENTDDAMNIAHDLWREEVESSIDYDVVGEWTEELAEEYGLE